MLFTMATSTKFPLGHWVVSTYNRIYLIVEGVGPYQALLPCNIIV
jgi:hypothetical protein